MTMSEGGQHLGQLMDRRNPGQDASDGHGGTEPVSFHPLLTYLIQNTEPWTWCSLWYGILQLFLTLFILCCPVYYQLYTQEEPIRSKNPIYSNNPFMSRIIPRLVPPPRTAASLRRHICKIEGFSVPESCNLYLSLSENVPVDGATRLFLQGDFGPGLSSSDPVALDVGPKEKGMQSLVSVETRALDQVEEQVQTRYGAYSFFELQVPLIGVIQFITAFMTRAEKSPRKYLSIKMIPHWDASKSYLFRPLTLSVL